MRDLCQVSGYVPHSIGVVPGPGVLVLAHTLRIRDGAAYSLSRSEGASRKLGVTPWKFPLPPLHSGLCSGVSQSPGGLPVLTSQSAL
jgi:hypothetical protein